MRRIRSGASARLGQLVLQNEAYHQQTLQLQRIIQVLLQKQQKHKGPDTKYATGYDLFFTFPEEIWPIIIAYLPNSSDLQSLSEASTLMESVVLKADKANWFSDKFLPLVSDWLPNDDLLKCRLVCKKWKLTVEKYLNIHADNSRSSSELQMAMIGSNSLNPLVSPKPWSPMLNTLYLESRTALDQFLKEAKAHFDHYPGESLLLSRSLGLGSDLESNINEQNADVDNQIDEYWEAAKILVRSIGAGIWKIELYNDSIEVDPAYFYNVLQDLLCNLPNLKTLRIVRDFTPDLSWAMEGDLTYRMGSLALPCLPCLESLHVLHSVPTLLATNIITKYAHQIRKFVVAAPILVTVEHHFLRGFVSLTELVIRDCARSKSDFFQTFVVLGKLEAPQLKRIRLFRSWSDSEVVEIGYLLGLLYDQFPKLIILDTHRIKLDASVKRPPARSPLFTLKTLKIQIRPGFSFAFLLSLPLLEELWMRTRQNIDWDSDSSRSKDDDQSRRKPSDCVIDIEECLTDLYQSNIWRKLPCIRIIKYENSSERVQKTYTREMHTHLNKLLLAACQLAPKKL